MRCNASPFASLHAPRSRDTPAAHLSSGRLINCIIQAHRPCLAGAVIHALRQETGSSIDLQKNTKDANGPATVTLRGSMEAMLAAKTAIEHIIAATE